MADCHGLVLRPGPGIKKYYTMKEEMAFITWPICRVTLQVFFGRKAQWKIMLFFFHPNSYRQEGREERKWFWVISHRGLGRVYNTTKGSSTTRYSLVAWGPLENHMQPRARAIMKYARCLPKFSFDISRERSIEGPRAESFLFPLITAFWNISGVIQTSVI